MTSLADLFLDDPYLAARRVLEVAGEPLKAGAIKDRLVAAEVPRIEVARRWENIQKRLKTDPRVVAEEGTYRFQPAPPEMSPAEALDRILHGRLPAEKKAALAEIVHAALRQGRQQELDGVRALSELAAEVEELLANDVEPAALLRRVRARVRRSGLEAIEKAGEQTRFDRKVHTPIGGSIRDGARVIVVRPGYVWTDDGGELIIGKAVVEE